MHLALFPSGFASVPGFWAPSPAPVARDSLLWKPKSVGGFPQAVVCGPLSSSASQHVLTKPVEQLGEGDRDSFLRGVNLQVPQSVWKVSSQAPL